MLIDVIDKTEGKGLQCVKQLTRVLAVIFFTDMRHADCSWAIELLRFGALYGHAVNIRYSDTVYSFKVYFCFKIWSLCRS